MNASQGAEAWGTVAAIHKQGMHMLSPTHTQIHDLLVYFLSIHSKWHFNESDLLKNMRFDAAFLRAFIFENLKENSTDFTHCR